MPDPVKPAIRRNAATVPSAETQPLTVNASAEVPAPASPAPSSPEEMTPEQAKAKIAEMANADFLKPNADGSITIELDSPVDVSPFGIPATVAGVNTERQLTKLTLARCLWKHRRAAARRQPANATGFDADTALVAELSGIPEHVLDELSASDMALVQMALGKFLFSPRML